MTYETLVEKRNAIFDNFTTMKQRDIDLDNLYRQAHQELAVGDGVTIHYYSDSEAYTVIKRTPSSITIQRDKARLNPKFEPKFEVGGFAGHCVNQDEQTYTYEQDANGNKLTLRLCKNGRFMYLGKCISIGRHEYYDYNF